MQKQQGYRAFFSPRRNMFLLHDFFKGSLLLENYKDIEKKFNNPDEHVNDLSLLTQRLFDHAVNTTQYYRSFSGYKSLNDFPVLPKNQIRENYQQFLSSQFKSEELPVRSTSGSCGEPFKIHFTKNKLKRQNAEVLFFNEKAGYILGDPFLQIRIHPKSKLALFMQNSVMLIPSQIDEEWLENGRNILLSKKHKFMVCYPSSFLPLVMYCQEKGDTPDKFALENIVTSAEVITESMRSLFKSVIGCNVHDRYATLETGVLAHECIRCGHYHVNFPSYHLELLKLDSDEPVDPGELGRIVITDFNSFAVPLIRYDIGDLAEWVGKEDLCHPHMPAIKQIVGRKDDYIIATNGSMVNPAAIFEALAFRDYSEQINQYQFIQHDKTNFELLLIVKPDFNNKAVILENLSKLIGGDANIQIKYVKTIPKLSSGKRPVIINHHNKN